jgi:hypothetical protein
MKRCIIFLRDHFDIHRIEILVYLKLLIGFMLSQWLILNADSVPGLLHCVDVGDVADVSEVPAASILDPEDGGSMYL